MLAQSGIFIGLQQGALTRVFVLEWLEPDRPTVSGAIDRARGGFSPSGLVLRRLDLDEFYVGISKQIRSMDDLPERWANEADRFEEVGTLREALNLYNLFIFKRVV